MSGDNYYFGDNVTMHGGTNNIGMIKNAAPAAAPASDPALQSAIDELVRLVAELRERVSPVDAQTIDDSLPALRADAEAEPQERHRALMAINGIAAIVGILGVPVVDAVRKVMELLGSS